MSDMRDVLREAATIVRDSGWNAANPEYGARTRRVSDSLRELASRIDEAIDHERADAGVNEYHAGASDMLAALIRLAASPPTPTTTGAADESPMAAIARALRDGNFVGVRPGFSLNERESATPTTTGSAPPDPCPHGHRYEDCCWAGSAPTRMKPGQRCTLAVSASHATGHVFRPEFALAWERNRFLAWETRCPHIEPTPPPTARCPVWCGVVTAELHRDQPPGGYWQRGVDNVLRGFCSKPCHDAGRPLNPEPCPTCGGSRKRTVTIPWQLGGSASERCPDCTASLRRAASDALP
jgi:hypothetical protein